MKIKETCDSPAATLKEKLWLSPQVSWRVRTALLYLDIWCVYYSKQTCCSCQVLLKSLVPLSYHRWDFCGLEVDASRVRGGRGVSITQTGLGDQAPELPQGHAWDPRWGSVCHVCVLDTGTIAKPWSSQDPQRQWPPVLSQAEHKVGWMVQEQTGHQVTTTDSSALRVTCF